VFEDLKKKRRLDKEVKKDPQKACLFQGFRKLSKAHRPNSYASGLISGVRAEGVSKRKTLPHGGWYMNGCFSEIRGAGGQYIGAMWFQGLSINREEKIKSTWSTVT